MRILKSLGALTLTLSVWAGLGRSALAAPSIDMLTDMQFVSGAAGNIECPPILVIDDGTNITVASDIRVIIPSTYGMTWLSSDTAVEVLMSASGAATVDPTCSYANSSQTLVLNVTGAGFAVNDRVVVTGVAFTGWNAIEDFDSLGLAYNGTDTEQAAATQGFCTRNDATGLRLSSANNFCFSPSTAAATTGTLPVLTVTDSSTTAVITAASGIRITIPNAGAAYGTSPLWVTSVTPSFGGTASGKVSTVAYTENGGRTCTITCTTNFSTSDTLTITGLQFSIGANEQYTADSLQLSRAGVANTVNSLDDRIFAIGPPNITVASIQTISASAANEAVSTLTITEHHTTAGITANSDIRLLILNTITTAVSGNAVGRDNLAWDVAASSPLTYTGTESANVNTTPTAADTGNGAGPRLLLLRVNTNFTAAGTLIVDGLRVDNSLGTATEIHIGLVIQCFTLNSASSAFGRIVSLTSTQNATGGAAAAGRTGGGGSGGCFLGGAQRAAR